MLRIKKLDLFVLKSFLLLFAGTFFICLFIFMMQFLWRYVDELVGKGLEMSVLAQFFFYSGLTLIPLSLPLAILLAALMTFGNFGERFELLSMKAAGIPLLRIIRPLIIFCFFLSCISFYFQNVIAPKAQQQLWTLLVSMKQTSPELDIPEGVFYDEIDGYNIYIKSKDRETGIMKEVLIYNFSDGFENAHIIFASEGKMEMTADKQHLQLHLYEGEQFENLKSQTISSKNVPYRRETFREKHIIIEFDSGFNMIDGSFLSERSDSKNMKEISHSIDSLSLKADSIGRSIYDNARQTAYQKVKYSKQDSTRLAEGKIAGVINIDSLYRAYSLSEKEKVKAIATYIADRIVYKDENVAGINDVFTSNTPVNGICGTYANAFIYLCQRADIPCVTIKDATHAWNEAYIDGRWQIIDVSYYDVARTDESLFTNSYPRIDTTKEKTEFAKELLVPGSTAE